jgi:LysM repeat protein
MKSFLSLATLAMALGTTSTLAQSELEILRARCAEQERQIRQLEEENSQLRGETPAIPTPPAVEPPTPPAAPGITSAPTESTSDAKVYIVQAGDSMPKISRKTGASVDSLLKINNLKSGGLIYPGQKLKLPESAPTLPESAPSANPPSPLPPSGKTHEVQKGETFFSIAKKHRMQTADLINANPNIKPSALRPGQRLNLGSATDATTPTPAEPTAPLSAAPTSPIPPATPPAAPLQEKPITVLIEAEMTYSEFAAKHQTDTERLNMLNGLALVPSTILAKGSELYVPAPMEPDAP